LPQGLSALFLSHSTAALLLAAVIRYLFVGLAVIGLGAHKTPRKTWELLDSSLAPYSLKWWEIVLGMLAPWLGLGLILTFVLTCKELSLPLSLAPFNFTTLATTIHYKASNGTMSHGAFWCLALIALNIYPVITMIRAIFDSHDLESVDARHPQSHH
jgi:iron(III) transport system permease protein